jgi:hypothetical protein
MMLRARLSQSVLLVHGILLSLGRGPNTWHTYVLDSMKRTDVKKRLLERMAEIEWMERG